MVMVMLDVLMNHVAHTPEEFQVQIFVLPVERVKWLEG